MLKRPAFGSVGVSIDMTPMIDIVFQLLAFFIFTLRIVALEGDLGIQMPWDSRPGPPSMTAMLPLQVELSARTDGSLARIGLSGQPVADMQALRARVVELIGGDAARAEELEAELRCDEGLAYEHAVAALTALSGRRDKAGNIEPLIKKIRFR